MSTETPSLRERKRIWKQRQRERQREQRRAAERAEFERQERAADRLVPAVMRNPIVTPPRFAPDTVAFHGKGQGRTVTKGEIIEQGGVMLVGPRVEIVGGRAWRVLALDNGDPVASSRHPHITERHKRAARQLQQDWHDVGTGVGVNPVDYARSGGGGSGLGGHLALLEQIAARARLDGAMTHLGAFAPDIARVVLDCIPVAVWAAQTPRHDGTFRTTEEGVEWISLALDKLATFYWPPRGEAGFHILTFGPKREVYSIEVDEDRNEGVLLANDARA